MSNALTIGKSKLPAPPGPELPDHFRHPRVVELEAQAVLTEDEKVELSVLREEESLASVAPQYTLQIPELKIVHPIQAFLNTASGESPKSVQCIVLFARLNRTYWPTDDEKKQMPNSMVGPRCSSLDMETGQFFDLEHEVRATKQCATCEFNRDNQDKHTNTAGNCKLGQRLLVLPYWDGVWSSTPYLLRVPSSSVRVISAFYGPRMRDGVSSRQLLVELSLEKRETDDGVFSSLQIKQVEAPITNIEVIRRLQAQLHAFASVLSLPLVEADREAVEVE